MRRRLGRRLWGRRGRFVALRRVANCDDTEERILRFDMKIGV